MVPTQDENKRPLLDQRVCPSAQTATFAMGCFWGVESYFGTVEGVIRTRVGYAGGSTSDPTYHRIANHLETVQLEFDPQQLEYPKLLTMFFSRHTPTIEPRKRQYSSAIFYHSPDQKQQIETVRTETEKQLGQKVLTEVLPYESFYLAEERHQKWKLRREPTLLGELQRLYPRFVDFNHSTAIARVNGYVAGNGNQDLLLEELPALGLSYEAQHRLLAHFMALGQPDSLTQTF